MAKHQKDKRAGRSGRVWRDSETVKNWASNAKPKATTRIDINSRTAMTRPGLDGSYRETCIVCLRGTDTGLAFEGEAEWLLAGLEQLGVPEDEAYATLLPEWTEKFGTKPGCTKWFRSLQRIWRGSDWFHCTCRLGHLRRGLLVGDPS